MILILLAFLMLTVIETLVALLKGPWSAVNQYLGIAGIDVVILLIILLHVLYFMFFWKGSFRTQKLE